MSIKTTHDDQKEVMAEHEILMPTGLARASGPPCAATGASVLPLTLRANPSPTPDHPLDLCLPMGVLRKLFERV